MTPSEKGYTTVELMVVVALIAILALLGTANLTAQMPHYRLAGAGRQIVADLRLIRQKAVAEGRPLTVQFDPSGGRYTLPGRGDQTIPTDVRFGFARGVDRSPGGSADLPDDGISFNANRVTFQPNGTFAGLGGTIYLAAAGSKEENLAITVNMTGRVKTYRWFRNGWE